MTTAPSKAALLREMLAGAGPVRAVGAHDALTARLIEQAGFEAVWASSFALSASHGVLDAGLLTMTQHLDAAEAMHAVTHIPVIADCDTGYGGPLNVAYAVQAYERRGIAALCIEDKVFPKTNSFVDAAHDLVPTEEFVLKIRAGKAAQRGDDFMLIARTETVISGGTVTQALDRCRAYAQAGADAVLIHSKSHSPDEVIEFARCWDHPASVVAVPTTYSGVAEKTLGDAGIGLVIYANQGLRAAIRALQGVFRELAEARCAAAVDNDDRIASIREVFALQSMPVPGEVWP